MIEELKFRITNLNMIDRINIINDDILKIDLPEFDAFIANIPYQISSPLILKLIKSQSNWRYAAILLQEEFAQRLFASYNNNNIKIDQIQIIMVEYLLLHNHFLL